MGFSIRARWPAAMLAVGLMGASLAGCAPPPRLAENPNPPPPALRPETPPLRPVGEDALIWQWGHWDWTGSGYVWVAGEYVPLDGHTRWMPGYWAAQGVTWVWVPAHWI